MNNKHGFADWNNIIGDYASDRFSTLCCCHSLVSTETTLFIFNEIYFLLLLLIQIELTF
jgi:hypothetical protein